MFCFIFSRLHQVRNATTCRPHYCGIIINDKIILLRIYCMAPFNRKWEAIDPLVWHITYSKYGRRVVTFDDIQKCVPDPRLNDLPKLHKSLDFVFHTHSIRSRSVTEFVCVLISECSVYPIIDSTECDWFYFALYRRPQIFEFSILRRYASVQ